MIIKGHKVITTTRAIEILSRQNNITYPAYLPHDRYEKTKQTMRWMERNGFVKFVKRDGINRSVVSTPLMEEYLAIKENRPSMKNFLKRKKQDV